MCSRRPLPQCYYPCQLVVSGVHLYDTCEWPTGWGEEIILQDNQSARKDAVVPLRHGVITLHLLQVFRRPVLPEALHHYLPLLQVAEGAGTKMGVVRLGDSMHRCAHEEMRWGKCR
uniref:uncharacterized protein LOC125906451 n=1 Tax=Anopheles coluzzii TaxID=1518534 RepID=UPI0020FFCC4B|nr:uncharacterized protein LOC125906451 [Anopheles coluzzii]